MITVKTNINQLVAKDSALLKSLSNTDKMLRTAATTVLAMMKIRIHGEGLDASGNRIGTYSPAYMKIRTGNFGNSTRVSKGTNTGKLKDAGVFSSGSKLGQARSKFNRGPDTKVILSLTRQMENDEKVIAISTNNYGIGFSNKLNYDKSQWTEATYKRQGKIFAASTQELEAVNEIAQKFTDDAIRANS